MTEPESTQPKAPRKRRRALKIVGITAALALVAVAGTGAWYYEHLNGNMSTFSADGVATSRPPAGPTDSTGQRAENVLVLGSDSRQGGDNSSLAGGSGGGGSDTAILVHVYADHKHAVGVSIPRDTLVTIPACKKADGSWTKPMDTQMFNSAFELGDFPQGNPACTQNTVEALTGLRIDHTVVVSFEGFAAMTDAVHGVDVCVPNDVDEYGIKLSKGRQTLSGKEALDYVRARHGFGDSSDIGRIKRQQAFMSSLIKKVQSQGMDLGTLLPLADAATKSLTVDQDLDSPLKLAQFAQSMQHIQLGDIKFITMPWRYSGYRVAIVHPDADVLWQLLQQDKTVDSLAKTPAPGSLPSPSATPTSSQSASTGLDSLEDSQSSPSADPSPSTLPTDVPSGIAGNTRSADQDLCSDISFG